MVTLLQLDSCASHLIAAQFVHRSPFRNLKENLLHLFHVIHVSVSSLTLLALSLFVHCTGIILLCESQEDCGGATEDQVWCCCVLGQCGQTECLHHSMMMRFHALIDLTCTIHCF